MDVPDLAVLADECSRTQALGFVGKAAIHPTQVSTIQQAFTPAAVDVAWAKRIVEAYETNNGGVLLVDGKLIERPVIASAKRTLAIASTVGDV
jgi:citrate lyase beta subunit